MANTYGVGCSRLASQMVDDAKAGCITQPGKKFLDQKVSGEVDNLRAAIIQYTDNRLDAKYFGNKLNTDKGKIAGGLRLCSEYNTHSKRNHWYVATLGAEP